MLLWYYIDYRLNHERKLTNMIPNNFTFKNPFQEFQAEAGSCINGLILNLDTQKEEFAFMVKEETKFITRHKYKPSIELRVGFLKFGKVAVIVMMVLVNRDYEMLYETMFNFYRDSGDGLKSLEILSEQDKISLIFFNELNMTARNLQFNNGIKEDIEEMKIRICNIKPWTMKEFDDAKAECYKIYDSPVKLWNSLIKISGVK